VSVIGIAIFQFAFTCEGYMPSECNLPSPFSTQLGSFHFTEDRAGVRRSSGFRGRSCRPHNKISDGRVTPCAEI
jgi:hypothetical protein